MRTKIKRYSLIACLFLFLFVVIGGGLHLNAGGALIASATGVPLLIHVFNRWLRRESVEAVVCVPRNGALLPARLVRSPTEPRSSETDMSCVRD